MSSPEITEKQIKSWFDSGSFQRGKNYYNGGAILQPKIEGFMLSARCEGSERVPYHVRVILREGNTTISTNCSCPLGGACKHAVALLLQWLHLPESFNQVEALAKRLETLSKEDLINLMAKMIDKHPDLEKLVYLSLLSRVNPNQAADPAVIRRQVLDILEEDEDEDDAYYDDHDYYDDYHEHGQTDLSGLNVFEELIQGYFQAGEWLNAATVSITIIQTLLDSYDWLDDEEGGVSEYVDTEVNHLEKALANLQEAADREIILKAFLDLLEWDISDGAGGMGYRVQEVILESLTPSEKEMVTLWARSTLLAIGGEDSRTYFGSQSLGRFLLQLEADSLDDEGYIQICRQSGLIHELIERLLTLRRVEEAVGEASQIEGYSLLEVANRFIQSGDEAPMTLLIQGRAATEVRNSRYKEWLKERAIANGDSAAALTIVQEIFDSSPNLKIYKELSQLAQKIDDWGNLRNAILDDLRNNGNYALITQIHLEEGAIEDALRTVEQVSHSSKWYASQQHNLKLTVARAAEKSHPNASIRYYLEAAEQLIAARNRSHYKEAAIYLRKVRSLYQKLGQNNEWLDLIHQIREQNNALRAMHDEFNQVGLEA